MIDSLPVEFAELSNQVRFIQRKSPFEYSGSCPKCGGGIHSNGEYPDRFIMLLPERSKAKIPFAFCRKCNYKWWPGQQSSAVDPETIAILQQQAREAEERKKAERDRKLAEFSTHELWEELHRRMGDEQREWWRKNGVPIEWQDYLKLGYLADKVYRGAEQLLHSAAYTIPYFGFGFIFKTIQYRLCNPQNPEDRYRFEYDLGTAFYMTTPSEKISDEVIVCEGAKKGMVVKIWGEPDATVLAVPSKTDWRSCGIIEEIKQCGRVYIVFDPDCFIAPPDAKPNWMPQPIAFAKELGNARVVECPVKSDDAFLGYGMTQNEWKMFKKQAVRV